VWGNTEDSIREGLFQLNLQQGFDQVEVDRGVNGAQEQPSCTRRVLHPAGSAHSGARRCRCIRKYSGCWHRRVRFSRCFFVQLLRVQRSISFPGPREREAGLGQPVWPVAVDVVVAACLPVLGHEV
jgi:hypothetical protein